MHAAGEMAPAPDADARGLSLAELMAVFRRRIGLLVLAPLAAGALALGGTYLVTPTFTAKTTFLPPQQQQSVASAALSQLGALASLAGGAAGIKSTTDQYVSLMQSVSVSDRIVDKFGLMEVYRVKLRTDARLQLSEQVRITLGKKDGLISVEVDDHSPQRAADMANHYVDELRRMTKELVLTEAQQRRIFFEEQLKATREALAQAQQSLQGSGFNPGALKAEPKAAAETFARLNAEVTAAEVRLQTLRRSLVDAAPEVQQQQTLVAALRGELAKVQASDRVGAGNADYISRYRDYKYQEALFELFSRQFELARLDEARDGGLIQVVDKAQPPELKSKPRRGVIAVVTTALVLLGCLAYLVLTSGASRAAGRLPVHRATEPPAA